MTDRPDVPEWLEQALPCQNFDNEGNCRGIGYDPLCQACRSVKTIASHPEFAEAERLAEQRGRGDGWQKARDAAADLCDWLVAHCPADSAGSERRDAYEIAATRIRALPSEPTDD